MRINNFAADSDTPSEEFFSVIPHSQTRPQGKVSITHI